MERSKRLLIIGLLVISGVLHAGDRATIYGAFVRNDMALWQQTIDRMAMLEKASANVLLEMLNYHYGYIAWGIGKERDDEADTYLDRAWEFLQDLETTGQYTSSVDAYKAAFYGFEIGLHPYKAPVYGPRSLHFVQEAMRKDSANWFAVLQYGNILYYMPVMFGGSKQKAIEQYLLAKSMMEASPDLIYENWNYLNLLVTIGRAYEEQANYQLAKRFYEAAMSAEPNFQWVKLRLYPALMTKIKQTYP